MLVTAARGLQTVEALLGSFNSAIDFFNQWEAKKIEERNNPAGEILGYEYKSLKSPRNGELAQEIRLLELHQRVLFVELRCKLIKIAIDNVPPFEAISYAWGEEKQNGFHLCVSTRRLRWIR